MFNKFPKKTGIYHIRDNIEQLELRICFRHINSLLKLPKFDYNKHLNGEWCGREWKRLLDADKTGDNDDVKIINLKWQEKLFSAAEEELYMDAKNCLSETQKKYHEWLLEKAEAENNASANKELERVGSRRRRKKRHKKPTKIELKSNESKQKQTIFSYVHEDNFHEQNKQLAKSFDSETVVHMYIFAAIDVDTELVHLQWFPKQHMLHIYPDFNALGYDPYFIEIDKDYRHLYAYAVENASQTRPATHANDLALYLQLPEYAIQPYWRTEEERAALFNMPPKRTRRISLLMELRDAGNFEYDGIHVRYHIQLPQHAIHEEGLLEASTHTSCSSESGIHYFGYNWQLTVLCDEEKYVAGDLLHIYFEVISIDFWERERVEGYTHLAICPFGANALKQHRLQCLRPVLGFWPELERFFIGGRRQFDYKQFFGGKNGNVEINDDDVDNNEARIPADDFHSRYGCRMQCTGYLQFSCQRFTQHNCELLEPCPSRRTGMTLDDIMCAYREARKRLEAVSMQ